MSVQSLTPMNQVRPSNLEAYSHLRLDSTQHATVTASACYIRLAGLLARSLTHLIDYSLTHLLPG